MKDAQASFFLAELSVKKNTIYWLALIALPWLVTSFFLLRYSVDAPRLDDFEALLHWHTQYQSAHTLSEKLNILFSDYQNHRYGLLRLPLIFSGTINFQLYAYFSPIMLLVLLGSLALALKNHPQQLALTALASFCLCNLQLWPAAVWAPLGSANLLYATVGLCSALLIWQQRAVCGWLLATLLCISHGSGPLLLLALGIACSIAKPKAWQHWLFVAVVLVAYFVLFPTQSQAGYSSFTSQTLMALVINNALNWLGACLQLIGSVMMMNAVNDALYLPLSALIGVIMGALFAWSAMRGHWRQAPVIFVWLLFLALVCASIAAGRALTIGNGQMLQGHYKLLSNMGLWLGLSSVLLLCLKQHPKFAITGTITIAALIYTAAALVNIPALKATQQAYWQDSCQFIKHLNQQQPAKLQHPTSVLFVKQPNKKLKAAYDSGFYRPNCDD